eukprot:gene2795-54799_t
MAKAGGWKGWDAEGSLRVPTCPMVAWIVLSQGMALYKLDPVAGRWRKAWLGAGEWLSTDHMGLRWGVAFRAALPGEHAVLALDVAVTQLALLQAGAGGGSCRGCGAMRLVDALLACFFVAFLLARRPSARRPACAAAGAETASSAAAVVASPAPAASATTAAVGGPASAGAAVGAAHAPAASKEEQTALSGGGASARRLALEAPGIGAAVGGCDGAALGTGHTAPGLVPVRVLGPQSAQSVLLHTHGTGAS